MATRYDEGTVAIEVHRRHRHGVATDDVDALPSLHLPNPNRLIEGAGNDVVRLRVEVNAENGVGVAAEGLDTVASAGGVPDAEGAVVGGGADVVGVGGPGEVGDAVGMAGEAVEEGEGGGGPDD